MTSMEFHWHYAEPFFRKLDQPGYGTTENWLNWRKSAWETMVNSGLVTLATPMDETVVKLRLAALNWLTHDFCGAVLHDEYSTCPYWNEWSNTLELDFLSVLASSFENKLHRQMIDQSPLMEADQLDICEEDGEVLVDHEELTSDLKWLLVMNAVYEQRKVVWDCLANNSGGGASLFTGLYRNCIDFDRLIDDRESELEEDLKEFTRIYSTLPEGDKQTKHQQMIAELKAELERPALIKFAENQFEQDLADGLIVFGDETSREKVMGMQWCISGQPVVVRGEPQFWIE